jgi:Uncharacterized conserved protein
MSENKKRINAVIDEDLYIKVTDAGYGITEAITLGFTKLLEPAKLDNKNEISQDIIQEKESRIQKLQDHNEILMKQLEELKNKKPENKEILQLQELRIQELQEQIKNKDSQQEARIKDLQDQLKVKDGQLERLTDTMQAQAVQLQTLINQKALEAPGAKKPWWRFW